MGNGPFIQYHFFLFVLISGLMSIVFVKISEYLSKWITPKLTHLIITSLMFLYVLFNLQPQHSNLRNSLGPVQQIIDTAKPDDRFQSFTAINPIVMLDADPNYFMYLLCFSDDYAIQNVFSSIKDKRPKFIVGINNNFWGGKRTWLRIPYHPNLFPKYYPFGDSPHVLIREE
jgi:hypothetical protein